MCGFIGLINIDTEMFERKKEELTTIMRHRGPDNVSVYVDAPRKIALVHNRLSIIDLNESANQPMIDKDTGNVIVFNGEIYNYSEIKKEFSDISWETNSDTEIILKLYARLGSGVVRYLNGIFSFAIYDNAGNKMVLCRDRFGVKPLYYLESASSLIFASEVKAILNLAPQGVNYDTVYEYLEYGELCHDSKTFFENIYSLPPAYIMEYDLNSKKTAIKKYWKLSVDKKDRPEGELLEDAFYLLKDSMRLNMVSDVEVAISLSSGLDSSAVFHLARMFSGKIKAFTFGFQEAKYDEVRRVKESAILSDIEHYPVQLRKEELLKLFDEAIYYFETPFGGLGTLASYNMMKTVRGAGIKVILSGEGSDEIFGGYGYYYAALFKDLEHDETSLNAELAMYNKKHDCDIKPFSKEYDSLLASVGDRRVYANDGTVPKGSYASDSLRDIYNEPEYDALYVNPAGCLRKVMYRDLTRKKLPKLLHFQDSSGMASSVEVRVPFLDYRLIELLYSADVNFMIKNGEGKYLLKRILKDKFGFVEKKKTKHYVSTPQREWLKSRDVCDPVLERIKYGELSKRGLIDTAKFEKDYRNYAQSRELGNSFFIWKVLELECFFRQKWF